MPDRNFMRPTMPDQADVMYAINTIHERSDDLAKDVSDEHLVRAAGADKLTQRILRIALALALSAAAILGLVLILSRMLGH